MCQQAPPQPIRPLTSSTDRLVCNPYLPALPGWICDPQTYTASPILPDTVVHPLSGNTLSEPSIPSVAIPTTETSSVDGTTPSPPLHANRTEHRQAITLLRQAILLLLEFSDSGPPPPPPPPPSSADSTFSFSSAPQFSFASSSSSSSPSFKSAEIIEPERLPLPSYLQSEFQASPSNIVLATQLIYQAIPFIDQATTDISDLISGVLDSLSIIKYGVFDATYAILSLQGYIESTVALIVLINPNSLPGGLNESTRDMASMPFKDSVQEREKQMAEFRQEIQNAMESGAIQENVAAALNIVAGFVFAASYIAQTLKGREEVAAGNRATIIATRRLIDGIEALDQRLNAGVTHAPLSPLETCLIDAEQLGHPNLLICHVWRLQTNNNADFSNQNVTVRFKLPSVFMQSNITRANGRKIMTPTVGTFTAVYDFPDDVTACNTTRPFGCHVIVKIDISRDSMPFSLGTFVFTNESNQGLLTEIGGEEKVYQKVNAY